MVTKLSQRGLSGKEHMAIIVNVNPLPKFYCGTDNILTESARVEEVLLQNICKRQPETTFSEAAAVADINEATKETPTQAPDDDIFNKLIEENENLRKELTALKSSMPEREEEIRREMDNKYRIAIKRMEENWKKREETMQIEIEQLKEIIDKLQKNLQVKDEHLDLKKNKDESNRQFKILVECQNEKIKRLERAAVPNRNETEKFKAQSSTQCTTSGPLDLEPTVVGKNPKNTRRKKKLFTQPKELIEVSVEIAGIILHFLDIIALEARKPRQQLLCKKVIE